MEKNSDAVTVWLLKLADRDERAAEEIWNKYFEKVVRFAKHKLGNLPRRIGDEEDIAVSAMGSFMEVVRNRRFYSLNSRDDLWKLLVTIAARKLSAARRRHFAPSNGGGNLCGESALGALDSDTGHGIEQILGREPEPKLAAEVADQCNVMMSRLDDPLLKEIAQLKLEGYSNNEIAERMNRNVRTVERKLSNIRDLWSEFAQADHV